MKKNYYVNMWLRTMLRLMKQRKGFVNQSTLEGHIRKEVFSENVDDIVENIHSAEHLARMMLLWARDLTVMDQEEIFDERWNELGAYMKTLMSKYGDDFCRQYDKSYEEY